MRRRGALGAMLVLTSAVAALASAAGAATQQVGSVSVTPGAGSALAPSGGYFVLSGAPGAAFEQMVNVTSAGAVAVTATVRGVDASTAAGTGVTYGAPSDVPGHVGTWITPEAPQLELGPRATRSLRFAVRVPAGTAPGQYLGGLSVALGVLAPPTATTAKPGFGVAVTMQAQRVLAVEVDVPGAPYVPNLVVRNVGFATVGQGRVLVVTVANDGNGFARGTGTITAAAEGVHEPIVVGTFVPGTTAEYQVPWPAGADDAHPNVAVSIDYGGRTLRWSGVVGAVPAPAARNRPNRSGGSDGIGVGVVVLAAGGLALVLGVTLVLFTRGRRAPRRRTSRARRHAPKSRVTRAVPRTRGRG